MEGTVLVFESKIVANARVHAQTHATHYQIPSICSLQCPNATCYKQVLNPCPIETMHIIVFLLAPRQSLSTDKGLYHMEVSLVCTIHGAMPCHALTKKSCALPCLDPKDLCVAILWGQTQNWLPHPCPLRGPQTKGDEIRIGCLTPAFWGPKEGGNAMSSLHSRGPQTKGDQIRSGCLTPAISKAQKRADVLRHPCILRDPRTKGDEIKVGASPLPSPGPKRGRKPYDTPAFSGVPKQGDTITSQNVHQGQQ